MQVSDPILSDADLTQLATIQREALGRRIEQPRVMRVGRKLSDTVYQVDVPNAETPGMIWCRPITPDGSEAEGAPIPVPNSRVPRELLDYGSYVDVGPEGVLDLADLNAHFTGGPPTLRHKTLPLNALEAGLLRPTDPPTMRCVLIGAPYVLDGTLYYPRDRQTKDFSSDVPVADAIGVLLEIDPATATLYYTTSPAFDTVLDLRAALTDYLPRTVSANRFALGYIRLRQGQTAIRSGDILVTNELWGKVSAALATNVRAASARVVLSDGTGVIAG